MSQILSVEPLRLRPENQAYHLALATLGYEARSRHWALQSRSGSNVKIAWEFADRHVHSFESNREAFRAAGYQIIPESEGSPSEWLRTASAGLALNDPLQVCIDISSMSRSRMATTIEALLSSDRPGPIEVDFCYSEAEYVPPPDPVEATLWAGPVTSSFAGWTDDPGLPSVLLLGMGYEPERAMGAIELITPMQLILFEPIGSDSRFTSAILHANNEVVQLRPKPRVVKYFVEEPFATFLLLEGMISRMCTYGRPLMVPLGPKIFALSCLLAAVFHKKAAVWRVSAGREEPPIERHPTGSVVGLHVRFGSMEMNGDMVDPD